ncbi:MAG: SH3 domain-containing protein [Leptodesmis sp.]|uniref:SH3 domain-containing protein n=1 Tax=Leptodesmis sp. TaxID=3100501 RepID=UPI003D0B3B0D
MEFRSKMALAMGISFAIPITIAGLIYAIAKTPLSQWLFDSSLSRHLEGATICQTLTADPKPPLNIRSSPEAANDNVVGHIPNGTLLTVVDESEGWLRISSPISGWVYKELTVTSCVNPRDVASQTMLVPQQGGTFDRGIYLMAIATQQYQSGNLNGAIALVKTVAADSPAYPTAKLVAVQWPQEWNRAEARYYSTQKALRDGRWQDVIMSAREFPDIRFWKEKLTPIVKQAIKQSQPTQSASGADQ